MKLFTHNFLTSSSIKGVLKGYPLIIHATKIDVNDFFYFLNNNLEN